MPPTPSRSFHVLVVLYNSAQWIDGCLRSALAQTLPPARITVVDNGSTDDGPELAERIGDPRIHVIRAGKNLGFAGGNNRAAAAARDMDFLLLLNPDAVMAADTLQRLADAFQTDPAIGVLGCKVLEPDVATIQHVGIHLRGNGLPSNLGQGEPDNGQYSGIHDVASVLGAAMAVRADTWCELGGLDEAFWPGYYEETDFCFRARRAGWRVAVARDAVVTHFDASADRRRDPEFLRLFFRNRARFLLKHYRARDWLFRYLPDETRWLTYWGSRQMRRIALRSLWQVRADMRRERKLAARRWSP